MAYTDYASLYAKAQEQYPDIPPGLLAAQGQYESGFNPAAHSPAGAVGISQFMPATAHNMGVNPTDPASSIMGQAALMHENLQRFGNVTDALRAYNGGNNFANIPSTASYASNVLAAAPKYAPQPQPGAAPVPASLGSLANQVPVDQIGQAPQSVSAPASLGQMAASLPGGNVKAPSKFNFANIAGVLGDALSAYGGRQPTFGPFLQQEKMLQQQHDFEMQKYQQQIAMQLAMMRSGLDTDLGKKLVASGVQPGTPQWTNAMATSTANDLDPTVNTAQGPVLRSSVVQATQPPAAAIARLKSDLARGDHSALTEFEQYYGPGSSIRALGAQ